MFMFGLSIPIGLGYTLFAAVGGYAVTSVLLLHYPELLHKKKKQNFHCSHISHRGG